MVVLLNKFRREYPLMRKKKFKSLVSVLVLVCVVIGLSAGAAIFYGVSDLGGGWQWSPWYGYIKELTFVRAGASWFNHSEHGIQYITGDESTGIWMYDYSTTHWWYTKKNLYPYFYSSYSKRWFWYQRGSKNPRWMVGLPGGGWPGGDWHEVD